MASQTDLDQGGTPRHWVNTYLGPSVGWVYLPGRIPFPITTAGTFILQPDTSIVPVNVAGAVIIILPSALDPLVPAGVLPALFAKTQIVIGDIGNNAEVHPITIRPASVAENIMGQASITISVNYGGYTLIPSNAQRGWIAVSP